jgi:hypothetical protein
MIAERAEYTRLLAAARDLHRYQQSSTCFLRRARRTTLFDGIQPKAYPDSGTEPTAEPAAGRRAG